MSAQGWGRDRYDLSGEEWALIRRVSTDNQYDNFRFEQQESQTREWLEGLGAGVRLFDENVDGGGKSGRKLEDRPVARAALDAVEAGGLRGIAGLDFARLSRDEYGIDAGTMFACLANAKGRIAAERRVYDPRDPRDLDDLRRLAAEAGRHMLTIRDQFWDGVFGRAMKDIFFQGMPPFGYSTRQIVLPDPRGRRSTPRLYNKPMKHPDHAQAMADLADWFEDCATWAEVLEHFNPRWGALALAHARLRKMPENRDRHGAGWGPARLRQFLDPAYGQSEVYTGRFRLGRRTWSERQVRLRAAQKKSESPIWDIRRARLEKFGHVVDGRTPCVCEYDHSEYGDLSYWTAADAAGWLKKFAHAPVVRRRTYAHPLKGILVCAHAGCGAVLVGAGDEGYVCPRRQMRACPGQRLNEGVAWAQLRSILPELLRDASDYAVRYQARQATGKAREALREAESKARHWERTKAFLTAQCYGKEGDEAHDLSKVPETSWEKLTQAEQKLKDAQALVERERAALADDGRVPALVKTMRDRPLDAFDRLPPEKQARLYRLLVADVRIAGAGRGFGRRWEVVGYTSLTAAAAKSTGRSGISESASSDVLTNLATLLSAA